MVTISVSLLKNVMSLLLFIHNDLPLTKASVQQILDLATQKSISKNSVYGSKMQCSNGGRWSMTLTGALHA